MSNYTAIAAATASLAHIITRELERTGLDDVHLSFLPPNVIPKREKARGINIYMFDVGPNMAWRNQELPLRSADGSFLNRPRAAIDVRYLLSFYGEDDLLTSQLLLAAVTNALNVNAVLEPQLIEAAIRNPYNARWRSFLARSNLAQQADRIKFHPVGLSLDDLANLWGLFHHAEFHLSVVYHASVVLIDADVLASASLPATDVNPGAAAGVPSIQSLTPLRAEPRGTVVVEFGSGLGRPSAVVFNGTRIRTNTPSGAIRVGQGELHIKLDPALVREARLESGAVALQLAFGEGPALRLSEPALFSLLPTFAAPPRAADGKLHASMTIDVSPSQTVIALLVPRRANELGAESASIPWVPASRPTASLEFPLDQVRPGEYLVQISIDGCASPLERTDGVFSGPSVRVGGTT